MIPTSRRVTGEYAIIPLTPSANAWPPALLTPIPPRSPPPPPPALEYSGRAWTPEQGRYTWSPYLEERNRPFASQLQHGINSAGNNGNGPPQLPPTYSPPRYEAGTNDNAERLVGHEYLPGNWEKVAHGSSPNHHVTATGSSPHAKEVPAKAVLAKEANTTAIAAPMTYAEALKKNNTGGMTTIGLTISTKRRPPPLTLSKRIFKMPRN